MAWFQIPRLFTKSCTSQTINCNITADTPHNLIDLTDFALLLSCCSATNLSRVQQVNFIPWWNSQSNGTVILSTSKVYLKFGLSIFEGLPRIFLVIFKEKNEFSCFNWLKRLHSYRFSYETALFGFFWKNLANSLQEFGKLHCSKVDKPILFKKPIHWFKAW